MARNLEWLLYSKYSDKKIIVWAANAHIMKNADTLLPIEKLKYRTMGTVFTQNKKNADQTYIIGFTSRQGTAGRINKPTYQVPKPVKDGFESWINKGIKYAFTDFRKYTQYNNGMTKPFYMKGLGLNAQADWSQLFDGVFYIRDMYPCQKTN
jgi:erythromycin esterase-like protein